MFVAVYQQALKLLYVDALLEQVKQVTARASRPRFFPAASRRLRETLTHVMGEPDKPWDRAFVPCLPVTHRAQQC